MHGHGQMSRKIPMVTVPQEVHSGVVIVAVGMMAGLCWKLDEYHWAVLLLMMLQTRLR